MKLTTVAAALVGLSVGSALAMPAHNTNVAQANNTQPALVQGNSVMPDMQTNLGKHLWVGGMINVDALYATDYALTGHSGYSRWVNTTPTPPTTAQHANTDLYLNNANIIVGGKLGFMSAVVNLVSGFETTGGSVNSAIQVDEAYVNFYDFSQLPIYAKVGKFYTQYGDYNPLCAISWVDHSFNRSAGQCRCGVGCKAVMFTMRLFSSMVRFSVVIPIEMPSATARHIPNYQTSPSMVA